MTILRHPQFFPLFLVGLLASLSTLGCGTVASSPQADGGPTPTVTITVSAAASLQEALDAIEPQFQATHPDIEVDYNFGASGALQQQIEQGAPTDVFVSAATAQMDALAQKGMIEPNSRQDLVTNSLVLIAPTTSTLQITEITQLKATTINRLAVGEFRSVPAGAYAEQVLAHTGMLEPLRSKLVFGNSIRSTLSAVESGNAEVGLVYATDAALSKRVKVLATAPQGSHQPIVYPIALVTHSAHPDAAKAFIQFLTSEPAQETFKNFGFGSRPSTS